MMRQECEEEKKPIWPTWAVDAVFRGARCKYQAGVRPGLACSND